MIPEIREAKLSGESPSEHTLTLTLKDSHQNKLLEYTQPITGIPLDAILSSIHSALASLIQLSTWESRRQEAYYRALMEEQRAKVEARRCSTVIDGSKFTWDV